MEIRILGPLEVVVDGKPLPLGGTRERGLLALLALSPGQTMSTDRIIDSLWGEDLPANPSNALQAVVSRLRRAIGAATVVTRAPGYALDVEPQAVDAVRFQTKVKAARAEADPAKRARLLRSALDLWRGEVLADLPFEEFGQQERRALEEMRLAAVEARIDADLEMGRAAELIAELEELVATHPLRESLRASQMLALYRTGRQADALRAFADTRNTLGEELGIEPGPELRELEEAILLHDPDLLAKAGRPPAVPQRRPLPARLASFVGREHEMKEIAAAFGTSRLVTLTGAGGAGKTSLAIEVGRKLEREYPDGVWLVELGPVTEPTRVEDAVVAALDLEQVVRLGTEAGGNVAATDMLVRYLRERQALVIVDNCEHVIDAAAAVIEAVLMGCPETDVLATSRDRLGITGELLWRVPPLGMDNGAAPADAIALFVDRSKTVMPGFAPTPAEREAIAGICRKLDGMPLAIELAAARVRSLPVGEIADRLETGIGILSGGSRHAAHRQHTLKATIDWSYDLLSADERALFGRLSVFHGSFTFDAVAAIAPSQGGDRALESFERLLDSSMVAPVSAKSGRRFRMLETIRMYAADKLAGSGDADGTMEGLLDYLLTALDPAQDGLRGSDQLDWLDRIEADLDTIRGVLDWAQDNDPARALRLAGMMGWFWFLKGSTNEARYRLNTLLDAAGSAASPRARGDALFFRSLHDPHPEQVRDDFAEARAAYTAAGYPEGVANAEAMVAAWGFDIAETRSLIREAEKLCVAEGYEWGLALIRFLQAGGALVAGDNRTAVANAIDAADRFAALGDRWGQGYSWYHVGIASRAMGEYDRAEEAFESALRHARPMRLRREMAPVMSELGSIATMRGDYERAEALLVEAQEYADDVPFAGSQGMVRNARGKLARSRGDLDASVRLHREAVTLYGSEAGVGGLAYSYACLGLAEEMAGDLDSARDHLLSSLENARQSGDPFAVALALEGLGVASVSAGDPERGVELISAGLGLRERTGTPLPSGERFDVERALGAASVSALREEEYEAAWVGGRTADVDALVDALLDAGRVDG
jgi:predicted ATPase/DNA-binding SARP family transcriptional activator